MNNIALVLNPQNINISDEVFNFNLGLNSLGYHVVTFINESPSLEQGPYGFVFVDQLSFDCLGISKAVEFSSNDQFKGATIFLILSKPLSKSEKNIVSQHRIKTITKPILPISLLRKFRGLERL